MNWAQITYLLSDPGALTKPTWVYFIILKGNESYQPSSVIVKIENHGKAPRAISAHWSYWIHVRSPPFSAFCSQDPIQGVIKPRDEKELFGSRLLRSPKCSLLGKIRNKIKVWYFDQITCYFSLPCTILQKTGGGGGKTPGQVRRCGFCSSFSNYSCVSLDNSLSLSELQKEKQY